MPGYFKPFLVFLLAAGISAVVGFYGIRLFTKSADEIVIPDLSGKDILYVLETLTSMGLNVKLRATLFNEKIPRHAVIAQSPPPGSVMKKGRDILIDLSRGSQEILMPDLRQVSLEQAGLILEKQDIAKGSLSYTFSESTPKGSIISQAPHPFSRIQRDAACHLLISRGRPVSSYAMPELTGQSIAEAKQLMDDYRLPIAAIHSDVRTGEKPGTILSQSPKAGRRVWVETPVTFVVNSLKKNQTLAPDLLSRMVLFQYKLAPGFIKSHVRVETDLFGRLSDLYNEHMKPGEDIYILVPAGQKTHISIFIDHTLKKTFSYDPWDRDQLSGDLSQWELSPPQSYPQTLPNSAVN